LEDRFWEKVNKKDANECWEWNGAVNSCGYGSFYNGKSIVPAHRVSYLLSYGDIPIWDSYHGMCVCHICDNRKCVNPNHLFLGTHDDNMHDMAEKGRAVRVDQHGENGPRSKLTEKDVLEIKDLWKTRNHTSYSLAEKYRVSQTTIMDIIHKRTWSHL